VATGFSSSTTSTRPDPPSKTAAAPCWPQGLIRTGSLPNAIRELPPEVLFDGRFLADDPIECAVGVLRAGGVVAMKGSGGFHLVVDATSADAVLRLRKRKGRPSKPFAVLLPDLAAARALVVLSPADERLLAGPERPVVVAPRRAVAGVADAVAPGIQDLGVILPYLPLHWLLFFAPGTTPDRDVPRLPPLVFSSANRSGEPTLHDGGDAIRDLASVADLFLDHDRTVVRPNDDSVHRSAPGGPIPIRLSRGAAPCVLRLPPGVTGNGEPEIAVRVPLALTLKP
jgi:hydrogenase maturation protein HypF